MADIKTIDNLGVEISSRYAKESEGAQKELIRESRLVSPKTKIDITEPALRSAYDALFGLKERNRQWALFMTPQTFQRASSRIFGYHILPAIRSDEFGDVEIERIRARKQSSKKPLGEKNSKEYDWEEGYEQDKQDKESDVLLAFIEALKALDKDLIAINGRRNQYQKG